LTPHRSWTACPGVPFIKSMSSAQRHRSMLARGDGHDMEHPQSCALRSPRPSRQDRLEAWPVVAAHGVGVCFPARGVVDRRWRGRARSWEEDRRSWIFLTKR
jgi:hypothetical protein